MNTLMIHGNMLHFRDDGPPGGRAILFANSLGTDLRVWDALLPLLPDGLRLIRYDKRGHGLSDTSATQFDMMDLVADAAGLLDALGLQDVTVVGLSIGGMIAQGLASQRPDLVRALVLMDTAARIGPASMWHDRVAAVHSGGIAPLSDAVLQRWFAPGFHKARAADLALWHNMLCRTPAEGYASACAAIAGADFTETTRKLRLPALVMVGSEDGATPPDLVRGTADLLGVPCHQIAGAGHLPCVEKPKAVADLINSFLKETA